MKLSIQEALIVSGVMGLVILLCRALPFVLFHFRKKKQVSGESRLLTFIEDAVPPAAMTILAISALTSSYTVSVYKGSTELFAASVCAVLHLWKRNALISIVGGTMVYMILIRIFMQ